MVVRKAPPVKSAFLGGLGAALLLGGIFTTGLLVVLPFQVGLVETLSEALKDPTFYIFAGMAAVFLILASVGAYLCLRAYDAYRRNRSAVGAKND
jgi:hypothetical protein